MLTVVAIVSATQVDAQAGASSAVAGPIDVQFIPGGAGLAEPLAGGAAIAAGSRWTIAGWVRIDRVQPGVVEIAGLGEGFSALSIVLRDGIPALRSGGRIVGGHVPLAAGHWRYLAAVGDGTTATLYVDGVAQGRLPGAPTASALTLGRHEIGVAGFGGQVAGIRLDPVAVDIATIRARGTTPPDAALIQFRQASGDWPVQVRQMMGQVVPQPPATLPRSRTPADAPIAKPLPTGPAIVQTAPGRWSVGGWRLAAAPGIAADGAALSRPGYDARDWYAATVPGTVLTTLVDRGIYPDPAHGLNNLVIPEKLAHQDYWYRSEFDLPDAAAGRHLTLQLGGANYHAVIWVNGVRVGDLTGAFIRGNYDVTAGLRSGRNAIAIQVSPPPHPGLAHEESLTAGVGENGGMMMLDGPTFGATEGWDWIPTVRDRNTGLWQGVDLIATGAVAIGDAQVVTTLPRPDNSIADVTVTVPVANHGATPVTTTITAAFDDVRVSRTITLAPGAAQAVRFAPTDFPALAVAHPKLWWPNGYGDPALHMLHLDASVDGATSDSRQLRFGMREIGYELSLVDGQGALDRIAIAPARAQGSRLVDVRHQAIRKVENGWAYSLAPGALASPAISPIAGDAGLSPFMVIRVNGVRIAARGGNIGMDDFMKRTERSRLEPFFRLHRDAHLNIVRNWIGQDTEDNFYDLADEYGMMILNDFWESTQDYNIEAQDVPLFLQNADDVVKRYRNHPSIVLWFGRNEGVPQPILNEGLERVVREDDGTRLYMGSSNRIELHDSGPYNWRPPEEYFTTDSKGFAVEVGTPSFPTLEAWQRTVPATERWPVSDTWAYHDWHQTGNGAVKSFTDAMDRQFGSPTSLGDFERKAQMLEYVSYRAIFEGMNAGLWTTNSGRMLWMTQPAWPSSAWQIFSSDTDTHGAFYGTKKASEPVHVQMNLPDYKVVLVNNRPQAIGAVRVMATVTALDGHRLATREARLAPDRSGAFDAFTLDLASLMAAGPVLVRLEATDAAGVRLSDNFYWQAADDAGYRALSTMPQATLDAQARVTGSGGVSVTIANRGTVPAIETKLTLFDAGGRQILPAYFSDNYVSLLPGETRVVTIDAPGSIGTPQVRLRGWNITPASVTVGRAGR